MLPLLRARDARPVLCACYPFHRKAGYLAQAFDHVNSMSGLPSTISVADRPLVVSQKHIRNRAVRQAAVLVGRLRATPNCICSGPCCGAAPWVHLGQWVRSGDCAEQDAIAIVDMIGAPNAARVYSL